MNNLLLPSFGRLAARIYALSVILATTLLLTDIAAAQVEPLKTEPVAEKKDDVRIGVYLSGYGLLSNIDLSRLYGGGNIESPEDDIMPYPFTFLSIRLNRYEGIVGWRQDYDGQENFKHKHNEHIIKFAARYNYYPFKKNLYIYGGPVIWRFEKHSSLEKYVCTGDIIR